MDNEEIVNYEVEEPEEIEEEESVGLSNGVKVGVGIGLAILLGGIAYKIGKPALAKMKAKRERQKLEVVEATECDEPKSKSKVSK